MFWHPSLKPVPFWWAICTILGLLCSAPLWAQTLDEQFSNLDPHASSSTLIRDEADRLVQQGREQAALGQWAAAIAFWQQAFDTYLQAGDEQFMGELYDQLGAAYTYVGQWAEAESITQQWLALARDNHNGQEQITAANRLGLLLVSRRLRSPAQALFLEAQAVAQRTGNREGEGISLSNLGFVATDAGNPTEALQLYNRALPLLRSPHPSTAETMTLNRMGDAYRLLGQGDDAFQHYLAAYRQATTAGDRLNRYHAIDQLVMIYRNRQQFSQAYELLEERFQMAQTDQNLQQHFLTARSLAEFYVQTGDRSLAQAFYRQAIDLARQLRNTAEESRLMDQLLTLENK